MKLESKKRLAKEILIFWTLAVVNILALGGATLYNYYISNKLETINQATARIDIKLNELATNEPLTSVEELWESLTEKYSDIPAIDKFIEKIQEDTILRQVQGIVIEERYKTLDYPLFKAEILEGINLYKKKNKEASTNSQNRTTLILERKLLQKEKSEVGTPLRQVDIIDLLALISLFWLVLIYPLRGIFLSIRWAIHTVRN